MKTQGLKQALNAHKFDVAFGGARRDEEKSRAKRTNFFLQKQQPSMGSEKPAPGNLEYL